jgi:hypothetical protein
MLSVPEIYTCIVMTLYSLISLHALLLAISIQPLTSPEGCRRLRLPEFLNNQHMKVARLSVLWTRRLYLPTDTRLAHYCYRLSRRHDHSAVGPIGNRTCNLPAWSAVPQTAPPCTPPHYCYSTINVFPLLYNSFLSSLFSSVVASSQRCHNCFLFASDLKKVGIWVRMSSSQCCALPLGESRLLWGGFLIWGGAALSA